MGPEEKHLTVTMRDVARQARVSVGTVSQVFNSPEDVSPTLTARVLAAAKALGYRHRPKPRASTRMVRRIGFASSGDVGLVARPFYASILAGAAREGDEFGTAVTYCPLADSVSAHRIVDAGVDGILLAGYVEPEMARRLVSLGLPLVSVAHDPPGVACDRVLFDDIGGGQIVAEHLLRHGHRQMAVIHGPLERPMVERRVAGFCKAVATADGVVVTREVPAGGQNAEGGYETVSTLLAEGSGFTAVFCTSDRIAFGALQALREAGRAVPDDVSVVGFSDYEAAAHVFPPLTTVRTDTEYMGRLAVRRLIERAREPESPHVVVTLDVQLVERASIARTK